MTYERSIERHLLLECEKGWQVFHLVGDRARCPAGVPYVTFASHLKVPGEWPTTYPTVSEAAREFLKAYRTYAAGRKGMLFWRAKPEVEYLEPAEDAPGGHLIYARLVITEVPPSFADLLGEWSPSP